MLCFVLEIAELAASPPQLSIVSRRPCSFFMRKETGCSFLLEMAEFAASPSQWSIVPRRSCSLCMRKDTVDAASFGSTCSVLQVVCARRSFSPPSLAGSGYVPTDDATRVCPCNRGWEWPNVYPIFLVFDTLHTLPSSSFLSSPLMLLCNLAINSIFVSEYVSVQRIL